MIIGVTGGHGFIGSWIRQEAEARGHEVLILDHKHRGGLLGDVRDPTIVNEFAAHVDGIIHLAAVLGTAETIDNPLPAANINILGTLNVFEAADRYRIPIVYAAVGNSGIGRGTYCITKACGEEFVKMYREDRGSIIAAVRPMNAYGPRQSAPAPFGSSKVRKIVPSFVCSALSDIPMPLYGGGTQISDAVFVRDVAQSFLKTLEVLKDGQIPNHPIDIGNLEPVSVRQVAEQIQQEIPSAKIDDLPMRLGEPHGGPVSSVDVVDRIAQAVQDSVPELNPIDIRRAVKLLGTVVAADPATMRNVGIEPERFTSLENGIRITVDWFRDNQGITWRFPN
jgi:nucleoside-diphosphate-sugar epimerase